MILLRCQVDAKGKKHYRVFIDNNFYGSERKFFLARMGLLAESREQGYFRGRSALVSGDFFAKGDNLVIARKSDCEALFSGLESSDASLLRQYNKRHHAILSQLEVIKKCRQAGLVFTYGIMPAVSKRGIADIRREKDFILTSPEIPLPSFFSRTIPLPGTPYFDECVQSRILLPNLRLRDLPGMKSYCRKIRVKGSRYSHRLWGHLSSTLKGIAVTNALLPCMPRFNNNPGGLLSKLPARSQVGDAGFPDAAYTPGFKLVRRFGGFFNPAMISDASGCPGCTLAAGESAAPVTNKLAVDVG